MSLAKMEKLDLRIQAMERKLEAVKRMREALKADPDLFDLFDGAGDKADTGNGDDGKAKKPGRPKEPGGLISGGRVAQEYFNKIAA